MLWLNRNLYALIFRMVVVDVTLWIVVVELKFECKLIYYNAFDDSSLSLIAFMFY